VVTFLAREVLKGHAAYFFATDTNRYATTATQATARANMVMVLSSLLLSTSAAHGGTGRRQLCAYRPCVWS